MTRPGVGVIKTFKSEPLLRLNDLEYLYPTNLHSLVQYLQVRPEPIPEGNGSAYIIQSAGLEQTQKFKSPNYEPHKGDIGNWRYPQTFK